MIQETIAKIESKIEKVNTLKEENKAKLLSLLAKLKTEITKLAQTHSDEAMSITGFTDVSAHEATRRDRNPQLLELSLEGLSSSVKGFEATHPRLVEIVNSISLMLSNSGV